MRKQHHKLTAAEKLMGERFEEVRLLLQPDLVKHEAYGDALRPQVTAQTVRNWEDGRAIPDRMKRANCKLLGCDPAVFYELPGTPLIRQQKEHLERLRSDAWWGLTYEIATMLEATNGRELIEGWAQKYQELGDQETADFIRSEAKRAAKKTA